MARGGAEAELTRLVLLHFRDELEAALRAAFQEVVGSSLPLKFILVLDNPPRQTRKDTARRSPRKAQGRRPQPLKRDRLVAKRPPAQEAG